MPRLSEESYKLGVQQKHHSVRSNPLRLDNKGIISF